MGRRYSESSFAHQELCFRGGEEQDGRSPLDTLHSCHECPRSAWPPDEFQWMTLTLRNEDGSEEGRESYGVTGPASSFLSCPVTVGLTRHLITDTVGLWSKSPCSQELCLPQRLSQGTGWGRGTAQGTTALLVGLDPSVTSSTQFAKSHFRNLIFFPVNIPKHYVLLPGKIPCIHIGKLSPFQTIFDLGRSGFPLYSSKPKT